MKKHRYFSILISMVIMFMSLFTGFSSNITAFSADYYNLQVSSGFIYRIYDNYAIAMGYGNKSIAGSFNSLSFSGISAYIEGVPVRYISGTALTRTNITQISIPETVIEIWGGGIMEGAFSGTNISTVTIPKNVKAIGSNAFNGCKNLKSIYILNPDCEITDYELYKAGMTISNSSDGFSGIIYGYKNSKAQVYAEKCGYNFVDLDSNEVIVTSVPTIQTTTTQTNASTQTTYNTKTTTRVQTTATTTRITSMATSTTITKPTTSITTVNNIVPGPADGDLSDFSGIDVNRASVKPTLSLSRIELTLEEALANPTQMIELSVQNAKYKYAPTGIHVYWDSRLSSFSDKKSIIRGSALEEMDSISRLKNGDNGIFVATSSDGNDGMDGVMWKFPLTIPSDCKPGDVYPISITYRSTANAKDLFTNIRQDEQGQLMQAWVFTKGIIQGYIKIKGETVTTSKYITTNTNTTTLRTTTTTSRITKVGAADGDLSYFNRFDINRATIKPTLSISQIELSLEEAQAKPTQTVNISINGAEYKYAPTGIHIYWDNKLTLFGKVRKGDALKDTNHEISYDGNNGIFLTTSSQDDYGIDGVMWTLQFTLPSGIKPGDVYPIRIIYKRTGNANDLFTNCDQDEQGQLMEAWLFTNGIVQGYIKIKDDETITTDQKNEQLLPGDANMDKTVDLSDAVLIMQSLANPDKYGLRGNHKNHITEQGTVNADVEGGNGLTVYDALTIQRFLLNLLITLPI